MKGSKCREAQPAEQSRVAAAEQSGVREAAEHGEALIVRELIYGFLCTRWSDSMEFIFQKKLIRRPF